ncbi:MAG: glucosaminidase domain-containing protein [Cellvibrionaceae bacterium]
MADQNLYKFLYTKENGQPAAKWVAITMVLVAFSLFCLGLVFYLASYPLASSVEMASGERVYVEMIAPDFASMEIIDERKEAFFSFLTPLIEQENQRILQQRQRILEIKAELSDKGKISKRSRATIARLVEEYRFEDEELPLQEQLDKLLFRADHIPVSMVLAQAATESAWGTSRFAKDGNNFFGQWCFVEGCGAVPMERGNDQTHEVAAFDSARDSVRSYFRNINTHRAYRKMRATRAALREAEENIVGLELIKGLGSYSERGQDYINDLRQIITGNQLSELDTPQPSESG